MEKSKRIWMIPQQEIPLAGQAAPRDLPQYLGLAMISLAVLKRNDI
jgi:hypothetical protein